ncbi:hypothetical protein PRK78_002881 [Emydomyces testavorans]|uniref:Uncharacterized protein n=1 Tax=Emydomyces testavorans TaxID=2070801 RepID=A0AAF0DF41_9EURO|nr:hypothetical protein PRK78_002881 [Emydomyces testavorans]
MSYLSLSRSRLIQATNIIQPSRRSLLAATSVQSSSSSFHSSASRSVLKESDRHRGDNGAVASEIEKHKQEQLARHKDGHEKAQWVEELASSSEENVKADRGEIHDNPAFEKFQEKLKSKKAEEEKKA